MEFLKNWAQIVAVAFLCAALADSLAAEGATKQAVKLCIALFLCVALLTPLFKGDVQRVFQTKTAMQQDVFPKEAAYQRKINQILSERTCLLLSRTLTEEIHHKLGIETTIPLLEGHIAQDGSFRADRVHFLLQPQDLPKQDALRALVGRELGEATLSFEEAFCEKAPAD